MYRPAAVRRVANLLGPSGCQAVRLYGVLKAGQPPLVIKFRNQLKAALKARDAARLTALRAILAAEHNASKTDTPVNTNAQLIAETRKLQRKSREAMEEAKVAGREDLAEKNRYEVEVYEDIIASSGVVVLEGAELEAFVQAEVDATKAAVKVGNKSLFGDVMKRLSVSLEGKDVDRKAVAALASEMTRGPAS